MRTQTINPWTWQDALGYSQAVLVTQPHQTLYAAGQGSVDADGAPVAEGDMAGQATQAMDNVEAVLEAAGMDLSDVVRWDVYATDLQRYLIEAHGTVVKRMGASGRFPAGGIATEVTALAMPHMLLEIVVVAAR